MPKTAPKKESMVIEETMALISRTVDRIATPKKITTEDEYRIAVNGRTELKNALAQIETERKRLVAPLNAAVKHINEMAKPGVTEINRRIGAIDSALNAYEVAKEAKALKAAEKVAAKAEEKGASAEVVQAIVEQRVAAAVPVVQGMSFRTIIRGEVFDVKALCGAVAAGKAPVDLISVSQAGLNALAKGAEEMPAGTKRVEEKIRVTG